MLTLQVVVFCLLLQSDYEAANFDVKKAKGYWQLGRLGLEETQELQAKVTIGWMLQVVGSCAAVSCACAAYSLGQVACTAGAAYVCGLAPATSHRTDCG